jgi:hypothetical protein
VVRRGWSVRQGIYVGAAGNGFLMVSGASS